MPLEITLMPLGSQRSKPDTGGGWRRLCQGRLCLIFQPFFCFAMKTFFRFRLSQFATEVARNARPVLVVALSLLGTAVALPAQAAQTEPVQVTQPDAANLRVRISNTGPKPMRMQVVNLSNGQYLLNETCRLPAYGTLLRFSGLPTGSYAVLVRMGANRYRYTVQVTTPQPNATTIAVRETTTRRVESGLPTEVAAL
jgi:hypothetical protein